MNTHNNSYYLVLNSLNYFYVFQLDYDENLSYKMYDFNYNLIEKGIITEDKVLGFSVVLDDSNRINIIYLLKTGELYHKILYNSKWIGSIIGKYDTKSNRYNKLEVLFIENKLNIIYSYSNLINSNIYTIQHIVYNNSVEEQHNIVKYVSNKLGDPFVVDYDISGTIHLFYNAITNRESYIYYCFYSPYRKAWSINPKELSTPHKKNIKPYIFIDSSDNIHGLWLEEKNRSYSLQYNIMPTKGKNKYSWNKVKISHAFSQEDLPIVFEENSSINIAYKSSGKNYLISKSSSEDSWIRKEIPNCQDLIKLSISNKVYPNIKGKHIFGQLDNEPYIYLIESIKNSKKKENPPLILKSKSAQKENKEEKSVKSDFSQEDSIISEIKALKDNQIKLSSLIDQLLANENEIKHELNSLKNAFNANRSSFLKRLFSRD